MVGREGQGVKRWGRRKKRSRKRRKESIREIGERGGGGTELLVCK